MHYLIEVVQRNRVIKALIRTPDYDRALMVFQAAKKLAHRETRFFRHDDTHGRVLLKFVVREVKTPVRSMYDRN
jgi:hypothetical protein